MKKYKENTLHKLIKNQQDEKLCRLELETFYNIQLRLHPHLRYIYTVWLNDNGESIKAIDIELNYLQKELENCIQNEKNVV